ncbi:hypothetical protein F8S13_17275 [Chloroflexia bacterium SDU3-3]|nr:hypothetical protein F8S13_17275 [Chloroflexia bacterium SDU3-3]
MDMITLAPTQTNSPTLPPEHLLRATGTLRLVLVINLGSFVDPADADMFRHLRGSESFAAAIRGLQPQAPFQLDAEQAAVERTGYDLRIFRSRLIYNHFFPTYRAGWDADMRQLMASQGCANVGRWTRWTPRLRLTRNGLAMITLDLPLEDMPLIACTEQLLELPSRPGDCAPQDQWALGMLMLEAFLRSIGRQITVATGEYRGKIRFTDATQFKHTVRLDRYVVYTLRKITRGDIILTPEQLKREYAPTIATFMEGVMIERGGVRSYPSYGGSHASDLMANDVSTWDDELCLFTGESALLYVPLITSSMAYLGGPRGLDLEAYPTYWKGIMRGIEHLIAFRSEAQQIERRTTDLLVSIPGLTHKVTDGYLSKSDIALLDHLATSLSDIFDVLPELRSMAISASAFRADYVRHKFEHLIGKLAIEETLDLVNTNVEQLNFFLSYYNDMRLQWQGQRTNVLGITLGVIVGFMAISSFLADTFNVVDGFDKHHSVIITIVVAVVGLGLLAAAIRIARKRFERKLHRPSRPPSR